VGNLPAGRQAGKTSKYFKYAIGEIVLVVIGILIALQINNWNELRKNRQKETTILKQIHKDFTSNKIQLDSIKLNNQNVIAGCNQFISLLPLKKDPTSIDSIIKYFGIVFSIKTFNPSNGSIEALISSSTFDVIQNDTLRNLLVSWKDVYNDYTEEEQYARDLQIWELLPFIRKNMDFLNPYSEQNYNLISTPEFQNLWMAKQSSVQEILDAIRDERIEVYIDEIIRLTENHN
jgi:hypothetical protein